MSRRRSWLLAASGLAVLAALALAPAPRDEQAPRPPGPPDGLRLRLSHALGAPAEPSLAREPSARPRALLLRMDRMLDTVFTPALAAAAAAGAAAGADSAAADPAARAAPEPLPRYAAPKGPVRLELLARSRDLGEPFVQAEAFAPKSWVVVVPPPPPPPPPPPEAPRAPPLPFRFAGTLDDGEGRVLYFLLRGNAMLTAAVGDTIDNTYVLDRAEDGALQFVFLPLRERQQLPYGAYR